MNLGNLLNISASKYPARTVIISPEGRWSYAALDERTNRLAGAYLNAGLTKGDRIALLFYNSSYFVEAYFAAVKIGLVVTPVNFRFTGSEIIYLLNDAQPRMLLYGSEFEETLQDVRDQLVSVRHFVSPHSNRTSPRGIIMAKSKTQSPAHLATATKKWWKNVVETYELDPYIELNVTFSTVGLHLIDAGETAFSLSLRGVPGGYLEPGLGGIDTPALGPRAHLRIEQMF